MRTYYWLKLNQDWFSQKHIKKLRKIAGGDTYTCIYLKMLLKSLSTDGKLYCDGIEAEISEEIALDIDEDPENVKVTLAYLDSYGLVEYGVDEVKMIEVDHMTGKETDTARRVRKHRAQKALQCNTEVTLCNTEKEIEKEKELDKDKERIIYQRVVDIFNDTCVSFPKVKAISEARKKAIRARLKLYSMSDIETVFKKAEASSFLKGANDRNWTASFDWIMKDANMAKILDGNYDDYEKREEEKPIDLMLKMFDTPTQDVDEQELHRLIDKLGGANGY